MDTTAALAVSRLPQALHSRVYLGDPSLASHTQTGLPSKGGVLAMWDEPAFTEYTFYDVAEVSSSNASGSSSGGSSSKGCSRAHARGGEGEGSSPCTYMPAKGDEGGERCCGKRQMIEQVAAGHAGLTGCLADSYGGAQQLSQVPLDSMCPW